MRKVMLIAASIVLALMFVGASGARAADETPPPGPSTTDPTAEDGPGSTAPTDPDTTTVTDPQQPSDFIVTETGTVDEDGRSLDGYSLDRAASTPLRSCFGSVRATDSEIRLMEEVNRKRVDQGNQRMCVDVRLMRSSQDWSNFMARNHVFYHGAGLSWICKRENYCGYDKAFENLAYRGERPPAPVATFNQYLNSNEGHREAMLGSERDRMGTAFATNSRGTNGFTFNTMHMSNHPGE